MRCWMWRNSRRRSWMPCEGTIVNWLYKPGKTSNMVSLIPEARKYNIHKRSTTFIRIVASSFSTMMPRSRDCSSGNTKHRWSTIRECMRSVLPTFGCWVPVQEARSLIAWDMTISGGPAMAMTIPVRVVVFVLLIICLMCSFAVCSEIPMA